MWQSEANTHLTVRPTVILTEVIDPVIAALDPFFKSAGVLAEVTSGLRTMDDQLRIIQELARARGVEKEHPAVLTRFPLRKTWFHGQAVYEWQPGWSRLLNLGVIVNPPVPAVCLFDYVRSGVNRRGILIGRSPHMRGTAFDVGGGEDSVDAELAVVQEALPLVHELEGIVVERENNCLHHDCRRV
jgi:hypothetical protein